MKSIEKKREMLQRKHFRFILSLLCAIATASSLAPGLRPAGAWLPGRNPEQAASQVSPRICFDLSQEDASERASSRAIEAYEASLQQQELPRARANKKSRRRAVTVTPMALVTIVVTNTNDSGAGSLRQALLSANSNGMPDQIIFNIPAGDPGFNGTTFTIKPLTHLPIISGGDTGIDGTTQTAFTGETNASGPEIVLNGSMMPVTPPIGSPVNAGLRINSPNNSISSLVINGIIASTLTDPDTGQPFQAGGDAVFIGGPNADNNTVVGCYIGTDSTGASIVANAGNGVVINNGAENNRVGGSSSASRNLISGNQRNGIVINGSITAPTGQNTVHGNLIGTSLAGSSALANVGNGIAINGSANNLIGGLAPGTGNVLSGNRGSGVRIAGRTVFTSPTTATIIFSSGNTVHGNFCGTNASGTAAIPNAVDGVRLNFGATNNIVGGASAGARNVCSGNLAHGVHFDAFQPFVEDDAGNPIQLPFAPVSQNVVQGNFIGPDVTGTQAIGNQLPGVILFVGPTDNLIGGTGPGHRNIIAFNTGRTLDDGQGGTFFVPGDGVNVASDPANPGDPNPTVRNRISGNSIHSNNGLGIDLSNVGNVPDPADGPTPNDAGDGDSGPNEFQNWPVLTSASTSGGNTTVHGTLNSTPNTTFSIELFSNAACDASGFGEGQTFVGSTSVTTDSSGNASFSVTFPAVGCAFFTATTTDPVGNTSEFSNCINQAPVVTCSIGTTQLWPPNHNLINVGFAALATDDCPNPTISVQVFSDEDDEEETGDGNHSPDAKDIAPSTLRLRAERNGDGDGRVYLIIASVTDSSGNVSRCCLTVTVPHSQSKADKASVEAQAAAAQTHCEQFGTAQPGYFVIGDGPVIGPKQ